MVPQTPPPSMHAVSTIPSILVDAFAWKQGQRRFGQVSVRHASSYHRIDNTNNYLRATNKSTHHCLAVGLKE